MILANRARVIEQRTWPKANQGLWFDRYLPLWNGQFQPLWKDKAAPSKETLGGLLQRFADQYAACRDDGSVQR